MVLDHVNRRLENQQLINWLLAFAVAMGASSCASVTPPDGGVRDTESPKLIQSIPNAGAVRMEGRQITLIFNEPVVSDQLATQLTINPESDLGTPRIVERDNVITLTFTKPFKPNTTYVIDFGKTISDITERNKAQIEQLVFSTGEHLDSGQVSGVVQNLMTGSGLANATVGLLAAQGGRQITDSILGEQRFLYRTSTDETGAFLLRNVKSAPYRIFAFVDANKDSRYNEPEAVAYEPSIIRVNQADTTLKLLAAKVDTKSPIVVNRQEKEGSITLQYSEGLKRVKLLSSRNEPVDRYSMRRNYADARQVVVYGLPSAQVQRFILQAQDSAGNQRADTITTRLGSNVTGKASPNILPVAERSRGGKVDEWQVFFPTRIRLTKPQVGHFITENPTDTARLKRRIPKPPVPLIVGVNAVLDSTLTVITIRRLIATPTEQVTGINFDSLAIETVDLPGRVVSSRAIRLSGTAKANDVGTITVIPQTSATSFAMELLDEKNIIVERYNHWRVAAPSVKANLAAVTWTGLAPGKYRVRILVDTNGNGKWDGPDRTFSHKAEPVLFGPTELAVRANWEQEATINF